MLKEHISEIIEKTLKKINLYSDEAHALILATGQVESRYKYLKQIKGPALGFFQMEPATMRDILDNYVAYRSKYKNALLELGLDYNNLEFCLMTNIAIQVALCRLHYRRVPSPLPKTLKEMAVYWKSYYNSHLGKGTVEKFIKDNS